MPLPRQKPVIISAGVDWLTVTTLSAQSSMHLALHTAGIVSHQRAQGGIEKPWGMAGFSGFKCGEVEYATRGDEMMVRLMSNAARNSWRRVYELGDSVTRLDLQVTVEMHSECQDHVWSYYHRANEKSAKKKRGPRNRVILGNDGGATLYCGERTSTRFGRVYAKGPQSKLDHFKTALRFETQFNGRLGKLVAGSLYRSRDERDFAIARSVSFFLARIGHVPIQTSLVINDSCPRKRSDVGQKLDWLAKSVSPSVHRLLKMGYRLEVLRALNLDYEEEGPARETGPIGPSPT